MKTSIELGFKIIDMIKPSNFHVHSREICQLPWTVPWTAKQFYYALCMLNLKNPLTEIYQAGQYRDMVFGKGKEVSSDFWPLVALYLTDETNPEIFKLGQPNGIISGKLYPSGATTNSSAGVTNLEKIYPVFAVMEEEGVPVDLHGEVVDPNVALWDRERVFVDKVLSKICDKFPQLRIVLEHVSTKEGVQFVLGASHNVVATVAPHYMLCNCNDVYLRPTRNCFPMINSPVDQRAVIEFAVNSEKAIAGTDSAPHVNDQKFCDGGKGGCFVEPYAVSLYAEAFERANAMDDRFEQFMSIRGPEFYKLKVPERRFKIVKRSINIEYSFQIGPKNMYATPFMAGETLQWRPVLQ